MKQTDYPSGITEAELEQIKPCLNIGRQSKWPLLSLINAIFYVCDTGVKWRSLPRDFGLPWQTVYWYFQKWTRQGVWQSVNDHLVMLRRMEQGRWPVPSVAIVDAQSVANSPTATKIVGVDMGKKTKGRKRFMVVDSWGHLLDVRVAAACHHDGTLALRWWRGKGQRLPLLSEVELLCGDTHFGGRFKRGVEGARAWTRVITKHEQTGVSKTGMKLHKRRWVVERTFAWQLSARRLARDYERKIEHSEAFCFIASISRMFHNPIKLI